MVVLQMFISSLSIKLNPQINNAMNVHAPPSVSRMVLLNRLIRWYMAVTIIPTNVDANVAKRIGMKMSLG